MGLSGRATTTVSSLPVRRTWSAGRRSGCLRPRGRRCRPWGRVLAGAACRGARFPGCGGHLWRRQPARRAWSPP